MGLLNAIRTTAQVTSAVMNFCTNPLCLHANPASGCSCCARGHSRKSKSRRRK